MGRRNGGQHEAQIGWLGLGYIHSGIARTMGEVLWFYTGTP